MANQKKATPKKKAVSKSPAVEVQEEITSGITEEALEASIVETDVVVFELTEPENGPDAEFQAEPVAEIEEIPEPEPEPEKPEKVEEKEPRTEADRKLKDLIESQNDLDLEPTKKQLDRITFQEYHSMFELPAECKKGAGKDWQWGWCEDQQRMLKQYIAVGWRIVNRQRAPFIQSTKFAQSGAVEVEGTTRHLLIMRHPDWKQREHEEMAKQYENDVQQNISKVTEAGGNDGLQTFTL